MSNYQVRNTFTSVAPGDVARTLTAARAGDREAFSRLSEPHRLELLTHCYRMLGSVEDAEDQVQETFLRAWRRLDTYEGRASFRAWLYKIATNACLDALKNRPKRILSPEISALAAPGDPLTAPSARSMWIEPFPEDLLGPTDSIPEARYEAHEAISLAFLVALHVLPARQRSVLILSDVLGWSMAEIADALETTLSSVTSLLHRARSTLKQRNVTNRRDIYRKDISDDQIQAVLDRYMHAWETADIEGIVSLLTDDAKFPMPPFAVLIQGKLLIRDFLIRTILSGDAHNRWKLVPVRGNGQPGYAFYQWDDPTRTYLSFAIHLVKIENGLISEAITFGFPSLFRFFHLTDAWQP